MVNKTIIYNKLINIHVIDAFYWLVQLQGIASFNLVCQLSWDVVACMLLQHKVHHEVLDGIH